MINNKSKEFTLEMQELAKLSKTLSHPARLEILKFLSETKTCITGDITDYIPLGRSTVLQHLNELKNSGLIKGTITGKKVCYCINEENYNKAKTLFNEFLDSIDPIDNCC